MVKLEQFIDYVMSLATRIGKDIKDLRTKIGNLTSLSTTNKENLVSAINELKSELTKVITTDSFVNNLTSSSTTSGLSANQGKVIKGLLDALSIKLQSEDASLDTVQKIVTYIKETRLLLGYLSVDNIGGLEDELAKLQSNIDGLTKSSIGLGSVMNYGIATEAEAVAGTSNTKNMTPLRVSQYINSQVGDTNPLTTYNTSLTS